VGGWEIAHMVRRVCDEPVSGCKTVGSCSQALYDRRLVNAWAAGVLRVCGEGEGGGKGGEGRGGTS
jgi:hypothetical protein